MRKLLFLVLLFLVSCSTKTEKSTLYYANDNELYGANISLKSITESNERNLEILKKVELFKNNKELNELYKKFYLKTLELYNTSGEAMVIMNRINFIIEDEMTARPLK